MAKMTLTIPKASAVDSSGNKLDTGLSMTTGAGATAGRSILKAEYYTKGKKDTSWGKKQDEKDLTFLFTLQYVEFHKQIYSPNYIEAYILIQPEDIDSKTVKAFPSKDQLNELFATQLVELKCDDIVACDDYYVHEIIPRKYSDKMFVTLKVYSPDVVMTLQQYCKTFTAKRLGEEILSGEIGNFSITRDGTEVKLSSDTTGMKHIQTVEKDKNNKNVYTEHIFPYLVQYNESFYDFLARTTNRWGEFLYYENGKLTLGYSDTEKTVESYDVLTYCNWNGKRPAQKNAGPYVGDAPYDSNLLKSVVTEDGYDKVKNTVANMFDSDNGADVYWMKKAAQVLNNSKSITNFAFDTAVNDLVALGTTEVRVKGNNDKYYDAYFKDKKTDHGTLPNHGEAHYGTKKVDDEDKETYNEFSEASPMVDESTYSSILEKEMTAAKNAVNIEFDTKYPDLALGQVIDVDGEKFIVVEVVGYQPETEKKDSQSYYEKGYDSKVVRYRVTAIAKDSDGKFYPPMLPTGHVRTSGPQVAVVVDVDDPNRGNRVRVKYPWQLKSFIASYDATKSDDKDKIKSFEKLTADHLSTIDVEDATPWLLYASSSGPVKAGVHGRHYLAEKVLVDYAGGNVERPYVVGAVSADVPVALKTGSAVIMSPNNEYIKVHEGLGKGGAAFIANLNPGMQLINSFVPFSFTPDNEVSRRFEGGVEMGDKYGIWSIKASSDARNVSISSPWGDVKINAFTGISISAPNGDIKITGKNVTIAAGNNLTLTSGTNIRNKFASTYDGGKKFNVATYALDVANMVAKKLSSMVVNMFDLSILRQIVEVFWRPQEGALTVKSNRFLKLEAGGASAGYPDTIYKDPRKPPKKFNFNSPDSASKEGTLNMGPAIGRIISAIGPMVDAMIARYKKYHKDYRVAYANYIAAVGNLQRYANDVGDNNAIPCNNWATMKKTLWDKNAKKEITLSDLGFRPTVADDNVDKVTDQAFTTIMNRVGGVGRNRHGRFFMKKTGMDAKKFILEMRKERKQKVVEAANQVLKCVNKMRSLAPDTGLVSESMDWGVMFGTFTWYVPVDYIKKLKDAFKNEKCKDFKFYKYVYTDIELELEGEDEARHIYEINDDRAGTESIDNFEFEAKALKRRVALNFMESLGMLSQKAISRRVEGDNIVQVGADQAQVPPAPVTENDFKDDNKWSLYVESLEFSDLKMMKRENNIVTKTGLDILSSLKFWTPITEYYSWGNAKDGQILFGAGKTFKLEESGQISQVSSQYSTGKLVKADLLDDDLRKLEKFMEPLRTSLTTIGVRVNVGNQHQGGEEENNEEEDHADEVQDQGEN